MPRASRPASAGFADRAAGVTPRAEVKLKDPSAWVHIGNENLRRLNSVAKTTGAQQFPIDVRLPGMLTAVLARPPLFGAKASSFDAAATMQIKGVVDVVETPRGVAVVARDTWSAIKGRDALRVVWDESAAETRSSADLMAQYKELARSGKVATARNEGDIARALSGAAQVLEAAFEFPYLAHAAMEPLDAVARFEDGTLEIWAGHQMPDLYQTVGAQIMGIEPARVKLHVMTPGGFFGRRAVPDADVIVEVVSVLKATGAKAPVKVLGPERTTRRAADTARCTITRSRRGSTQRAIRSPGSTGSSDSRSWRAHRSRAWWKEQRRPDLSGGRLEFALCGAEHPGRSRDHGCQGARAVVALGRLDPYGLLDRGVHRPAGAGRGQRPCRVPSEAAARSPASPGRPNLVAEKAGWDKPLPEGRFRGVAVHKSFNTYVAQVAEISLRDDGGIRVERVVCAVDCGIPINPDIIKAQMEGGIGFGLGAILKGEITLNGGRVEQTNFDTYRMLTIEEMPWVEVHIVPSTESPTGVGEPGVPPIGPAVANAVYAATGKQIQVLPFSRHDFRTA